ncbi:hypothetical protein XaFJ1_GM001898 [Xanthomonas albilineans]|nr:hypothetical protein XaFJ1_GM001898 [Xanthomonas albilineans]
MGLVTGGFGAGSDLVGVFAEDFETDTGFFCGGAEDVTGAAATGLGAGTGAGATDLAWTGLAAAGLDAGVGTEVDGAGAATGLDLTAGWDLATGATVLATGFAADFTTGLGTGADLPPDLATGLTDFVAGFAGVFLTAADLAATTAGLPAVFLTAGLLAGCFAGAAFATGLADVFFDGLAAATPPVAFLATGLAGFLTALTAFFAGFLAATKRFLDSSRGPGKRAFIAYPTLSGNNAAYTPTNTA